MVYCAQHPAHECKIKNQIEAHKMFIEMNIVWFSNANYTCNDATCELSVILLY